MSYILNAITRAQRAEQIEEAIEAIVRAYYDEYTDAIEIDSVTHRALEVISEYADLDDDFGVVLTLIERKIARETKRPLAATTRLIEIEEE